MKKSNLIFEIIKKVHQKNIHTQRVDRISTLISDNISIDIKTILDIGCGDGKLSKLIMTKNQKVEIIGLDVMERPKCDIEYHYFDGEILPFNDHFFDAIQYIDVLHHTNNIKKEIENGITKTKKYVIIKDHIYKSQIDFLILKFMDWIGNAPHGVKVIYNFKKKEEWLKLFEENKLEVIYFNDKLSLYSRFLDKIFGRSLHFIAILKL